MVNKILCCILAFGYLTPVSAQNDSLRDPTTPLSFTLRKQQAPVLKLQAILNRSGKKAAVINGQHLYEGQSISGALIIEISELQVTFRRDGETGVLTLRSSIR